MPLEDRRVKFLHKTVDKKKKIKKKHINIRIMKLCKNFSNILIRTRSILQCMHDSQFDFITLNSHLHNN